jgi:hypothetical protein
MKKETARALMIVVGVAILLVVVGLASAVWLFTQTVEHATAREADVERTFDQIRQRFGGIPPLLDVRDGEPTLARPRPATPFTSNLTTLHVIAWDPDDEGLVRVDLPFWLLRLKSGPIELSSEAGFNDLELTVEDLERYGPTLVVDHVGRGGDRVLIWTE